MEEPGTGLILSLNNNFSLLSFCNICEMCVCVLHVCVHVLKCDAQTWFKLDVVYAILWSQDIMEALLNIYRLSYININVYLCLIELHRWMTCNWVISKLCKKCKTYGHIQFVDCYPSVMFIMISHRCHCNVIAGPQKVLNILPFLPLLQFIMITNLNNCC